MNSDFNLLIKNLDVLLASDPPTVAPDLIRDPSAVPFLARHGVMDHGSSPQ